MSVKYGYSRSPNQTKRPATPLPDYFYDRDSTWVWPDQAGYAGPARLGDVIAGVTPSTQNPGGARRYRNR